MQFNQLDDNLHFIRCKEPLTWVYTQSDNLLSPAKFFTKMTKLFVEALKVYKSGMTSYYEETDLSDYGNRRYYVKIKFDTEADEVDFLMNGIPKLYIAVYNTNKHRRELEQ